MKEFERWLDKGHICKPEHRMLLLRKVKGAEAAWRAALEMVKSEIFEHREALDVIEEELEN